jgi:Fe2+ transport system protein B
MPLINLVIILAVVGVLLYLINTYIPMQSTIKRIINIVVIIAVVIWLLSVFGIISNVGNIRVGSRYR